MKQDEKKVYGMYALAPVVWLKIISALAFFIVGLLVLRKDPKYTLNQVFATSFLIFGVCQLFDFLKDVLWPNYVGVVFARQISVVTGIFAALLFLLTGLHVRYGAHRAFDPKFLLSLFVTGIILSAVAVIDQVIAPTPDPLQLTVILMGMAGSIALFIVPALLVLASTIILFQTSRLLEDAQKRQSAFLLAIGMSFYILGAFIYAIEGSLSPYDPTGYLLKLGLTIAGLVAWLVGTFASFLAFHHRLRKSIA
jgi:hypothetical protein